MSLAQKLLTGDAENLLKLTQMYNIDNDDHGHGHEDEDEDKGGPRLSLEASSLCQQMYYITSTGFPALLTTKLLQTTAVNARGGTFGTALRAASAYGHKDVAQLVLDNGADVNAEGGRYGNALASASAYGHEEVARLLLDRRANIDPFSASHAIDTAFFQGSAFVSGYYLNSTRPKYATKHGKVMKLLMQRSIDVMNAYEWDPEESEAPSHYSYYKVMFQTFLDQNADDDVHQPDINDKLRMASADGDRDSVRQLLSRGASLIADGGHYGNALHAASAYGRKEVVEYLLDRGADINAVGGFFGNALAVAIAHGHINMFEYPLERGANVNGLNDKGNALYAASILGNIEVVQLLIDRGTNVNAPGRELGSALEAATCSRNTEIVQLLLKTGALSEDPGERDCYENLESENPTIRAASADHVVE